MSGIIEQHTVTVEGVRLTLTLWTGGNVWLKGSGYEFEAYGWRWRWPWQPKQTLDEAIGLATAKVLTRARASVPAQEPVFELARRAARLAEAEHERVAAGVYPRSASRG